MSENELKQRVNQSLYSATPYIGIKLVKAAAMTRIEYARITELYDGPYAIVTIDSDNQHKPGYLVEYQQFTQELPGEQPKPYIAWCPKVEFERANFAIANETSITQSDVDRMMGCVDVQKIDPKTTLVHATMLNGFEAVETSSCVSTDNYDHAIGTEICINRVKDKIWMLLGFVLQWAINGVEHRNYARVINTNK